MGRRRLTIKGNCILKSVADYLRKVIDVQELMNKNKQEDGELDK